MVTTVPASSFASLGAASRATAVRGGDLSALRTALLLSTAFFGMHRWLLPTIARFASHIGHRLIMKPI